MDDENTNATRGELRLLDKSYRVSYRNETLYITDEYIVIRSLIYVKLVDCSYTKVEQIFGGILSRILKLRGKINSIRSKKLTLTSIDLS